MTRPEERPAPTPGPMPWTASDHNAVVLDGAGRIVAVLSTGTIEGAYSWAEINSRARLIASAVNHHAELVEALADLLDPQTRCACANDRGCTDGHYEDCPVQTRARSLLQRVRGADPK